MNKTHQTQKISFTQTLIYHILPLLTIFVLLLPLFFPYLEKGYFPTHDGEWAVVRLGDMYRELRDGQFPARYSGNLNFGFGYPLFNFAYPLPYYLGAGLLLLKFGLVSSVEILFVFGLSTGVFGMYLLSSHLWKSRLAGVVSALLYIYFPFRMVDLYVRGSLGETVASGLFPFILLGFYFIHTKQKKLLPSIFSGIGFGLLILTHNIMAVLFLLVLIPCIIVFIYEKRENWKWYVGSLVYGFCLAAFFWIPALVEKQFVMLSQIPIADRNLYFPTIMQLLASSWGYAPPTEVGGFTYQIGWPHLMLLLLSSMCLLGLRLRSNEVLIKQLALALVSIASVFILMMLRFSAILWHLPLLSEINYPWTLLLPLGFVLSLLGGYLIDQRIWIRSLALLSCVLAIILYISWAKPAEYVDRGEGFYLTNDATTTSSDELMPLWVTEKPKERKPKVELLTGENGTVDLLENTSQKVTMISHLKEESTLQINTIYFPGWHVYLDGNVGDIHYDNPHGVMQIVVPKGTHRIEALFLNTFVRSVANTISLLSILILPVLLIMVKKMKGTSS